MIMNCSNCKYGKWIDANGAIRCAISIKEMAHDEYCGNYEPADNVEHPLHYNQGKYEVIDVIEDWGLDFSLGNALKYIARAEHKGKFEEDIKKAIWYLERRLKHE